MLSGAASGDAGAARAFLSLLPARKERDPGSVALIYPVLEDTIDFIVSHQACYAADLTIYGSFADRVQQIRMLCRTWRQTSRHPHARAD